MSGIIRRARYALDPLYSHTQSQLVEMVHRLEADKLRLAADVFKLQQAVRGALATAEERAKRSPTAAPTSPPYDADMAGR